MGKSYLMDWQLFRLTDEYKSLRRNHYDNNPAILVFAMWRNMHGSTFTDFDSMSPEVHQLWLQKERAVSAYELEISKAWRDVSRKYRDGVERTLVWDGEINDVEYQEG
jgi:hypothetical protein